MSDDTDINWVKYRRNPQGVKTFAKYKDALDQTYGEPLDADGFKEDLFKAASDNKYQDNDSIRYTCFIDEYYYGDENGNYDTQKGLPLKDFINTKPRTIQISTYFRENDKSPSTVSMAAAIPFPNNLFAQYTTWKKVVMAGAWNGARKGIIYQLKVVLHL